MSSVDPLLCNPPDEAAFQAAFFRSYKGVDALWLLICGVMDILLWLKVVSRLKNMTISFPRNLNFRHCLPKPTGFDSVTLT